MKTIHLTTALLICIVVCIPSLSQADAASVKNADQFISVGGYNNSWILNKTTRKLIFVQFKKKDKLWKSEVVSIPASYDLNHSVLMPAGVKVNSVFLYDQSSGMTTFLTTKGDHSVEKYLDYNAGEDLKLVYTPKTETSAKLPLKLPLRKYSNNTMYEYEVKETVIRYNFYESRWNSQGSFRNDLVDNGNGTITDKATSLMWEKSGYPKTRSLRRAKSYVGKLNSSMFAGYSDWRLPTLDELASLLESHETNGMYIDPLFDKRQKRCWSSDKGPPFGGWSSNPPQAWHVNFLEGTIGLTVVTRSDGEHRAFPSHNYVRAVRIIK